MTTKVRPAGYPPTPTLDMMKTVMDQSHRLGEFIDWLEANGFSICERHEHKGSDDSDEPSGCWGPHTCTLGCPCNPPFPHDPEIRGSKCVCRQEVDNLCGRHDGEYFSTNKGPEKLLAMYFKVDLDKAEDERRAILDWLSKQQK